MATQDRSPSLFAGQPWTAWEEHVPPEDAHDSKSNTQPETTSGDNDSMRLHRDDMPLFGICPAQDEFYLVVCEKCNQVIKPQAFRRHMEFHHGYKNLKGSKCHASSSSQLPSKSPTSESAGKDSSCHNATHPMPPTKASLKLPPPSVQTHINKLSHSEVGKPNHFKKTNTLPVVKVERISDSSVNVKKSVSMNHESSKKSSLTNGNVKAENGAIHLNMAAPVTALSVSSAPKPTVTLTFTTTTITTTMTKTLSSSAPSGLTSSAASTTSVVSSSSTSVNAGSSSSNKKSPKERKFLPCKDREFDPDKHCGCWIADIKKQCTRSLTCKTHALSLRRAVKFRSKTFDELLKEHRAAKEALLKAKAEKQAKSSSGTGPGGGGHGSSNKSSHNDSNTHLKDGSATSTSSFPSTSPQKNIKPKVKPQNTVFQRLTSSGIYPQPVVKEEDGPVHDASAHVSADSEADAEETADVTYFPYHPQPAAVCRFNARNNGSGCFAFSRKVDYVRAAFRSALERHLHPPAHKKLCVESKLPKEPHVATNSKDPYDFNLMETSGLKYSNLNSGVINSSHRIVAMKPKSKTSATACQGNKSPKSTLGSKSPGTSNISVCSGINPVKRKRSGSGQGVANTTTHNSQLSSIFGNIATIANSNSPITAIAIPNFGGTAVGHFSATLTSNKQIQVPKNNIIKDFNLVLTGIDPSMINGQVMNITTAQLAEIATQAQLVSRVSSADDKAAKRSRIVGANSKHSPTAKLSTSNMETFKTLQSNSVIVPQNAVLVDTSMQGHILSNPVSLTTSGSGTIVSLGNVTVSPAPPPQPSPSSASLFRTDSSCPQVSSSLPNGVVSSSSDHKAASSQRTSSNITKITKGGLTMNIAPGLLQQSSGQVTSQLCSSQGVSTAQPCPGAALSAPQLSQLQMKPAQINVSKNVSGKLSMQPVSVTIPIVNPASFSALGTQQGQQHTLFVTSASDGASKQELHLQPQISNSPSNVIS